MCVSHTPPCRSFWLSFLIRTALHSSFLLHPFGSLVSTNSIELLAVSQMIQFLLQGVVHMRFLPSLWHVLSVLHPSLGSLLSFWASA